MKTPAIVSNLLDREYNSFKFRQLDQRPWGTTAQLGGSSELLVCSYLLLRGYEVFRSVVFHADFDLVVSRRGKLCRVEVKTGRKNKYGVLTCSTSTKSPKKFDVLAICSPRLGHALLGAGHCARNTEAGCHKGVHGVVPASFLSGWGMPNRILKESIWTSPTLLKVSFEAASHFLWLLPLPDDHGCCQLTAGYVKGRLYPERRDVTESKIQKWHDELVKVDLIRVWEADERIWAFFPTWKKHQRVRSLHQRKTPEPPSIVVTRCQLTSNDGLNPNPNPNPNPKKELSTNVDVDFEESWNTYPKRNGKKIGKAQALAEWRKLSPVEKSLVIPAIIAQVEHSEACRKEDLFVAEFPDFFRWLKQKRFNDEVTKVETSGDRILRALQGA